ncbi:MULTISPECIES: response regulator [Trichocoleus]|uniref:Response regulator n=1 Tax=Trichocoleus desertorum GB2-A4 TaxID=2933944 RepID=A0ABV0J9G3_9CYAN|nr:MULTISPECIES: response regulator [unclassified Trichocoleus]MBD1862761.1 response regulator [Trichocoleus sp. FACHB-46]MBD2095073.1 response regulator [Trichocoleus sp. FACHB-591]MBD2124262.1 response regulator [Trichocoleus sp. FACHB-262]
MTKILLVEDNEVNSFMMLRRLQKRGYQVVHAADGVQAIAIAQAETPDLILMDMSLPVLDGWQATQQIKAAPTTHTIPIIALTAHALAGDRERCLAAGCDEYETKPVNFNQLLEKMHFFLNKPL